MMRETEVQIGDSGLIQLPDNTRFGWRTLAAMLLALQVEAGKNIECERQRSQQI
jgi:hypothetical protein